MYALCRSQFLAEFLQLWLVGQNNPIVFNPVLERGGGLLQIVLGFKGVHIKNLLFFLHNMVKLVRKL